MRRYMAGALAALLGMMALTHTAQAYRFLTTSEGKPLRWYEQVVPYYINTDGFSDFSKEEVVQVTQKCMETWTAVNFGLVFEYQGPSNLKVANDDDQNVIFFVQDSATWHEIFPSEGLANALGTTRTWALSSGELQGFDLAFNDALYRFTNSETDVDTDYCNTLTHELGHVLGLDHTDIEDAVMYSTSPRGETAKCSLHPDDVEGIRELYRAGFREEVVPVACSHSPQTGGRLGMVPLVLAWALGSLRRRRMNA